MEEIVGQYPAKVVAIHDGHAIYAGEAEEDVYQWTHKQALTPMPLVFRVPGPVNKHRFNGLALW